MLSLTARFTFPDLDRIEVEVECLYCALETHVTLREIRLCDAVICRGCHATIVLEDHLGQVGRAKKQLEAVARDIGR